ncbi:MAG: hypothetical protein ACP5QG_08380 [candidate division WOR-3 bacterium]
METGLFVTMLFSQALFAKSFDFEPLGWFNEGAEAIAQTQDGGYMIAGACAGTYIAPLLLRLDPSGNPVWVRLVTLGGNAGSILRDQGGNYVVAGSHSYAPTHSKILVFKMDTSGTFYWARYFGLVTSRESAGSIVQTTDGGYVVSGRIFVTDTPYPWPDSMYYFVLKMDPLGNFLWARRFGRTWDDELGCYIAQTMDGNLVVAGHEEETPSDPLGITVIKMDAEGNPVWMKGFGWRNVVASITGTADGGCVLAGSSSGRILILKLNPEGELSWARRFSVMGADRAESVIQASDGGIVVAGVTGNSQDLLVFKIDPSGNLSWARTFKEFGNGYSSARLQVIQTTDGGYAVTGYPINISILKINEDGDYPGCADTCWPVVDTPEIQFFPPAYYAPWTPTISSPSPTLEDAPGFVVTDLCPSIVAEDTDTYTSRTLALLPVPSGFWVIGYSGPVKIYDSAARLVLSREIEGKTLIGPLKSGVYLVVGKRQRAMVAVR